MVTSFMTVTVHKKTSRRHQVRRRKISRRFLQRVVAMALLFATLLSLIIGAVASLSASPRASAEAPIVTETPAAVLALAEQPVPDSLATGDAVTPRESTYKDSLTDTEGKSYDIPAADTGFKAYMDYRSITSKTSKQWAMQQEAWTDELGFRRYGDYYMVAMGTYYSAECGKTFHITFEGGEIDAIIGDIKADQHTDELHQHRNGNVVEFIIDKDVISKTCRIKGDMSWAAPQFKGKCLSIIEIPQPEEETYDTQ